MMITPARVEIDHARIIANETRSARRIAGLCWAADWRERMRPVFDRMEAEGAFVPADLGR